MQRLVIVVVCRLSVVCVFCDKTVEALRWCIFIYFSNTDKNLDKEIERNFLEYKVRWVLVNCLVLCLENGPSQSLNYN